MKITDFIGDKAQFDNDGGYIFGVNSKDELQMIGEIRGWGAIQNLFKKSGGAIDIDKAYEFQN